jgi:phosphoribosylformylglycinamidine cyclo-ligase
VNIEAKAKVFERIKGLVKSTATPAVLADMGAFGGMYSLAPMTGARQALVASADSVGTKVLVARMAGRHDTVGLDIVHHCANDILVQGARPLFLLDYIAMSRLEPAVVEPLIAGLAAACRGLECALLGGETAELPGLYPEGDYDLVGFIVGAVAEGKVPDPAAVRPGDIVLGLPSSGLHTNGYSLARKVFFDVAGWTVERRVPELGRTLGEELMEPHRCYTREVLPLLEAGRVKALAHLTGGGFFENIPRSLPDGIGVEIERGTWPIPPIFRLIQQLGGISDEEMHRVFNMGVGMTLIAAPEQVDAVSAHLRGAGCPPSVIGRTVPGQRRVTLIGTRDDAGLPAPGSQLSGTECSRH